ncbi:alpha/beta hydrolase [Iamia sp.]|uniref:alpha/beta hydrolase n=1 Tax=Iamia sp. TaxID=2722710 RepID=UPI002B9BBDA8|nr:alpha/beta fold hydrolase [Iamia sp.]HXH57290.1 alpha/beta fold hydrolase [Iamia sp.]
MSPPILLIHGTFSHGGLLAPWVRYFESAGYRVQAPSLPGRLPIDPVTLRKLTMSDCLDVLRRECVAMEEPPIVIGHSMGGLLGQQLAASAPCSALVLLASAPPGVLWAQPRALPHLARLMPRILAGRPFRPSASTLKAVVFNDLPDAEARAQGEQLAPDSGRVFRSMVFGLNRVPRRAVQCPVLCLSGGVDRNVSARISRSISSRYDASHHEFARRGHWLIAPSGVDEVASVVLRWLQDLGLGAEPSAASTGQG